MNILRHVIKTIREAIDITLIAGLLVLALLALCFLVIVSSFFFIHILQLAVEFITKHYTQAATLLT